MRPLDGVLVLVVEDEAIIAMDLEDALTSEGAEVIGPAFSVREAMQILETRTPHVAVLDLNLAGEPATPVALALAAAHVPFVVASAHGRTAGLPIPEPGAFVPKTYKLADIIAAVVSLVTSDRKKPPSPSPARRA